MKLYVIGLSTANKRVENRISEIREAEKDFEFFKYSDNIFFIASIKTSDEIAHEIGLKGEHRFENASGVVIRMNGTYSGFTRRSLWDWLGNVDVAA